jgi:hypothetical protein
MATAAGRAKRGTTWARFCKLAVKLPGVEVGRSYGTPALHVRKRFLARLKEDGETVALRVNIDHREMFLELDPGAFYLTDHYRPYPAMLVRLKQVRLDLLEDLLEQGWRQQAPKSLVAKLSAGIPPGVGTARARKPRRQVKRG